jgi:predicted transcriptional regulator
VICLECGKEFKQITKRHLREHGLDAKQYRKKYGFSARQPLTATSLTAKRRKTAKALGLAEKLQAARKAKAKSASPKKPAAPKKPTAKKKTVRRKKKA